MSSHATERVMMESRVTWHRASGKALFQGPRGTTLLKMSHDHAYALARTLGLAFSVK